MTSADDEKRRIEYEERVRSIFDRGEEHHKAQRTAAAAAERKRAEAREERKTDRFAVWLLFALLATLILAGYVSLVASGSWVNDPPRMTVLRPTRVASQVNGH